VVFAGLIAGCSSAEPTVTTTLPPSSPAIGTAALPTAAPTNPAVTSNGPTQSFIDSPSGLSSATGSPSPSKGGPPLSQFDSPAIPTVGNRHIPVKYTCDGQDISPPLRWDVGGPFAAYAITVTDPDAHDFVHWVVAGIPGDATSLPEGAGDPNSNNGLKQGRNGFGKLGYGGPCPPAGPAHRYAFDLYAFAQVPSLPEHPTVADIQAAANAGGTSRNEFSAFYGR
jgi:Raf kinase inhibitor-like YbhB/YbcL family protein